MILCFYFERRDKSLWNFTDWWFRCQSHEQWTLLFQAMKTNGKNDKFHLKFHSIETKSFRCEYSSDCFCLTFVAAGLTDCLAIENLICSMSVAHIMIPLKLNSHFGCTRNALFSSAHVIQPNRPWIERIEKRERSESKRPLHKHNECWRHQALWQTNGIGIFVCLRQIQCSSCDLSICANCEQLSWSLAVSTKRL